ncbi:molybdopterin-dependent oxidoreductase, partial [Candidatus Bathyarchaeota archaeon]|nr:molybdopterin-dependent oxidoreductase [Candidatus Bathyarchaeota archaeon]
MKRLLLFLVILCIWAPGVSAQEEEPMIRLYGAVENPVNITYSGFLELPMVSVNASCICVGSPPETPGLNSFVVYTYNWTGIRLVDLLDLVEPTEDAVDMKFGDFTLYSSSIPIEEINRDNMILAVYADGETLNRDQGYPFRVVLPCYWGYKWVKYVSYIEITDYDHKGYWESHGYPDDGRIADCVPLAENPEVFTNKAITLIAIGSLLIV